MKYGDIIRPLRLMKSQGWSQFILNLNHLWQRNWKWIKLLELMSYDRGCKRLQKICRQYPRTFEVKLTIGKTSSWSLSIGIDDNLSKHSVFSFTHKNKWNVCENMWNMWKLSEKQYYIIIYLFICLLVLPLYLGTKIVSVWLSTSPETPTKIEISGWKQYRTATIVGSQSNVAGNHFQAWVERYLDPT